MVYLGSSVNLQAFLTIARDGGAWSASQLCHVTAGGKAPVLIMEGQLGLRGVSEEEETF
jgi:hypothetical protein